MMNDYKDIEGIMENIKLLVEVAYDRGVKARQQDTISDIIENVKTEMCDKFCKYPWAFP